MATVIVNQLLTSDLARIRRASCATLPCELAEEGREEDGPRCADRGVLGLRADWEPKEEEEEEVLKGGLEAGEGGGRGGTG